MAGAVTVTDSFSISETRQNDKMVDYLAWRMKLPRNIVAEMPGYSMYGLFTYIWLV